MKKRALVILSRCEATRSLVADRVAGEYRPEHFAAMYDSRGESPRAGLESEFAVCHLKNRLRQGDTAPLLELFQRMTKASSQDDYNYGSRLQPLITCCRDELRESDVPWSAEQCKALAKALRGIFDGRDYVNFNDYRGFNSLLLALQSQTEERSFVERWIRKLAENNRNQMEGAGLDGDIWAFGKRLNSPAAPENLDVRLRFVEDVLRFSVVRHWIRADQGPPYTIRGDEQKRYFEQIAKSGLLSEDELVEHGQEIVTSVGVRRVITPAWAAWLQASNHYEQAAVAWRAVVDMALEDRDANSKTPVVEKQVAAVEALVACLEKVGKNEEALAAAETYDGQEMEPSLKERLQKIKDQLGRKPAANSEKAVEVRPNDNGVKESRLNDEKSEHP